MKSIRREHASLRLLAHEAEEIDPPRARALGLPRSAQMPARGGANDRAGVVGGCVVNESGGEGILWGVVNCSGGGALPPGAPVPARDLTSSGGGPAGLTAGLYAARANMK